MTYRVLIAPRAEGDLKRTYRYLRSTAPEAARGWIKGIRRTIQSVEKYPERGRLAPESASFGEPVRELFYGRGNRGTYRILYTVMGKTVFVVHVRHGSMLPAEPDTGELL
jgi:plasmid stabilization system protein ParE